MELKDVIHHYLGCKVIHPALKNPRVLTGRWLDSLIKTGIGVKPLLRKLSSMTDQEIDEIASILLDKETHCYHKWRSEDGDCIIADWKKEKPPPPYNKEYESVTMGMLINEKFEIKHKWDYHNDKGAGTTNEPLYNSHAITVYLCKKGFDIFQLIESNQAIDINTQTEQ